MGVVTWPAEAALRWRAESTAAPKAGWTDAPGWKTGALIGSVDVALIGVTDELDAGAGADWVGPAAALRSVMTRWREDRAKLPCEDAGVWVEPPADKFAFGGLGLLVEAVRPLRWPPLLPPAAPPGALLPPEETERVDLPRLLLFLLPSVEDGRERLSSEARAAVTGFGDAFLG